MYQARTCLTIEGTRFFINGQPTYRGSPGAEGLLFNIRTVNATFDDTLGKVNWWDDDGRYAQNDHAGYGPWRSPISAFENTRRFVDALPEYKACGILAVNLNFQGGHPLGHGAKGVAEGEGSAGARPNGHRDFYHNSGFRGDGSIEPDYAQRISMVIEACDKLGMAVILQLFYFGQDTVFAGPDAIRSATDHAVDFVCEHGYRNVIMEIANEVMHGHYKHGILAPGKVAELIVRAQQRSAGKHGCRLPVSTSEAALARMGAGPKCRWTEQEADATFAPADLIVIHGGDNIETGKVGDACEPAWKVDFFRSRAWYKSRPRPIITNESQGIEAFEALVKRGVSFGLHDWHMQTLWPPKWGVWDNEMNWFFQKVKDWVRPAPTRGET